MKALLLRVGIDKGRGGTLGPIFNDGSFEFVPIPEQLPASGTLTYNDKIGRFGKRLSTYVPLGIKNAPMHEDPEFITNTYGDPTIKRYYLFKLAKGDLLAFYAGLKPFATDRFKEGLYIIGYFSVKRVINFNNLSNVERQWLRQKCGNNAHIKRHGALDNLVIVVGDENSRLLKTALLISEKKANKAGRLTDALSSEMEKLLGISGFIQRSIPPRFVFEERNVANLMKCLASS